MAPQASHLLSLPAELRLQIYSYILAPTGSVYLSATRERRHAVTPPIHSALLQTCRQIHHEGKDVLYADNTINIVIDAHDTCWPTISESHLPQHVLERLEHFEVLLDCTSFFCASYGDVDFLPFVAMQRLKTLRLRMLAIDRRDGGQAGNEILRFPELVGEILGRVGSDVAVSYGAVGKQLHGEIPITEVIASCQADTDEQVIEVPAEELLDSMRKFDWARRGIKAQFVADVWSEYRTNMSAVSRGQDSAL